MIYDRRGARYVSEKRGWFYSRCAVYWFEFSRTNISMNFPPPPSSDCFRAAITIFFTQQNFHRIALMISQTRKLLLVLRCFGQLSRPWEANLHCKIKARDIWVYDADKRAWFPNDSLVVPVQALTASRAPHCSLSSRHSVLLPRDALDKNRSPVNNANRITLRGCCIGSQTTPSAVRNKKSVFAWFIRRPDCEIEINLTRTCICIK